MTAPQANFFANANARVSSSVRGLSFTAHFVFHAVVLPSGEFKLTRKRGQGGVQGLRLVADVDT